MESESKDEQPFLKIETIWSENEGNFDSITIKEENISDCEPELLLQEQEDENYDDSLLNKNKSDEQEKSTDLKDCLEVTEKTMLTEKECIEIIKGPNVTCLHESKNFKVVKKRLRCIDCLAVLCPECYCTITSSLQLHFAKSDNNNRSLYPCRLCRMIFKSNCALQAHIRIHFLDTPYVCPDCGAVYNNIYYLSLHLINKCYHVYKVITNGCKFCLSQNMTPDEYQAHIQESHIRALFKCSDCGLMLENIKTMNKHLRDNHENMKAVSLRYFSCSMCGNLIISKHLYANHIKYHEEHSAVYQIDYFCPCGNMFNSISSFRSHLKGCAHKGVLPPQWNYLQTTLKSQEVLQLSIQKGNFIQTQHSSLYNDRRQDQEKTMLEDGASSEDEEIEMWNQKGSFLVEREKSKENSLEKVQESNEKSEEIVDNVEISMEKIPNVQLVEEFSQELPEVGVQESSEVSIERVDTMERISDKGSRLVYDHIPCDHLGYLKVHQADSSKSLDENQYVLTSVLDERTGFMQTKKVLLGKSLPEVEEIEHEGYLNVQCKDKMRSSTFFSCPFCAVLFPKHFSSFQRFRLHLECYHPDASLDITVDRTQIPKSQTKFTSIRIEDDFDSEEDSFDLDNVDLQTRLNECIKEKNDGKESDKKKPIENIRQNEESSMDSESSKVRFDDAGKHQRGSNDLKRLFSPKDCDELSPDTKICRVRTLSGKERYFKNISKPEDECQSFEMTDERRKLSERRNSRRESDVWSEFYKTLKIAETLKKTKMKKEGGDVPILTNYANKRVVKKPKRYRESSDSEESDGKSLDPEDDELYIKKKKLLNRLENVDLRIVDYICDLIDGKEKAFKKDVKTRKKLINGMRVRHPKASPNGENDEENADSMDLEENDVTTEKRRGRPRKIDPMLVRERRRSDDANLPDKSFEGDDCTIKRKRKLSKLQKMSPVDKNDFSSGQVTSESEKRLTCAVCKESYQTEEEFREHIRLHRMDDNGHQCMECGECFVVRPSLEKHLLAFHKIKDVQKYIEENDCSIVEKVDEADSEPLKENQCKVCRDEFANIHDLNKHFRIHGMAFLRQFKKDPKPN